MEEGRVKLEINESYSEDWEDNEKYEIIADILEDELEKDIGLYLKDWNIIISSEERFEPDLSKKEFIINTDIFDNVNLDTYDLKDFANALLIIINGIIFARTIIFN